MSHDLILASSSPRRKAFLTNMGLKFKIIKPDVDETPFIGEDAQEYVKRLAEEKSLSISNLHPDDVVLAADTIVVLHNNIIGKPLDREDAKRIIRSLSGQTHQVMTAVCICNKGEIKRIFECTNVTFASLDEELIETYVASGECDDKSGAYAVQGIGAMLIEKVDGSVSSVVGLPICQVRQALKEFNILPRTVACE